MQVSEIMTRTVRVVSPDETIQHAAEIMADLDAGVVPVGEEDRLVGMLTDRDIAVRAIAKGKGRKKRFNITAHVWPAYQLHGPFGVRWGAQAREAIQRSLSTSTRGRSLADIGAWT